MEEKQTIGISVRTLVEFLLRSGDLESGRGSFAERDAMARGRQIHRKIQKRMGSGYRAEVPLIYRKEYENFILKIEGRADGIFEEENQQWIDEIKGVFLDVEKLGEPLTVHLAQAKCYAYIYGREQNLNRVGVRMTYCNLESELIRHFQQEYTLEKLDIWFGELLDAYYKWADFSCRWNKFRNMSMAELEFPFPYREGQQELVKGIYRTIIRKKKLFVQAPTGVGKTMSAVFPAVRAMGEGLADKLFYLTAKTIARTVAEEAFLVLRQKGLKLKCLTLTAKEKLCVCDGAECNPRKCLRAKGHYDRVNDAVFELLTGEDVFTRERLLEQSERWGVCPYEMSLDLATWADAVICDYNYVFDPDAHLRRFFGEGIMGNYLFLVDEAHNLVERGREMFSAALYKEDFLEMKRLIKPVSRRLERSLQRCNQILLEYKRECDSCMEIESASAFAMQLQQLLSELEQCMDELPDGELHKKMLDFYFQVRSFVNIHELVDENYVTYIQHTQEGRFMIKQLCVNPAENLAIYLDKGRSTVFFSATLLPVNYYRKLFSTTPDKDYAIYVDSPFSPVNRKLLIGRDTSSRYISRGEAQYRRIANYLKNVVAAKEGNYIAFFPSYRFLEDVLKQYRSMGVQDGVNILVQKTSMHEQEREEFLENFHREQQGSLLGFCVMGGIFAEGIDLPGEKLIGAVIVGTGLPQVGEERELLKNYYDRKEGCGFDYAYRYPGMNKVLQSAGRVIRTKEDRGVIILLDERFCSNEYRQLFPREWSNIEACTEKTIKGQLQEFWEKN